MFLWPVFLVGVATCVYYPKKDLLRSLPVGSSTALTQGASSAMHGVGVLEEEEVGLGP